VEHERRKHFELGKCSRPLVKEAKALKVIHSVQSEISYERLPSLLLCIFIFSALGWFSYSKFPNNRC
jgi:hypothetical protein